MMISYIPGELYVLSTAIFCWPNDSYWNMDNVMDILEIDRRHVPVVFLNILHTNEYQKEENLYKFLYKETVFYIRESNLNESIKGPFGERF